MFRKNSISSIYNSTVLARVRRMRTVTVITVRRLLMKTRRWEGCSRTSSILGSNYSSWNYQKIGNQLLPLVEPLKSRQLQKRVLRRITIARQETRRAGRQGEASRVTSPRGCSVVE